MKKNHYVFSWSVAGAMLCCSLALSACGGGSDGPSPSNLALSASTSEVFAGGGRVALRAEHTGGAVQWSLAGGPGQLDQTSGDNVIYTPPASGVAGDTVVSVTATIDRVEQKFNITVRPALRVVRLLPAVSFVSLRSIAAAPDGTLYVSDVPQFGVTYRIDAAGRISEYISKAMLAMTFDRSGAFYVSSEANAIESLGPDRQLTPLKYVNSYFVGAPTRMAVTTNGRFYLDDSPHFRLHSWLPGSDAGYVGECVNATIVDGNALSCTASQPRDGSAATARFGGVGGIAAGPAGEAYVGDHGGFINGVLGAASLRKVAANGDVTTIAGGQSSGDVDGAGGQARFDAGRALASDPSGNVYALSTTALRRIGPDGKVTTLVRIVDDASQARGLAYRELNGAKSLVVMDGTTLREVFLP